MTFTRTASGISNYSKFYGVEITFIIEGRGTDVSNISAEPTDRFFYTHLFSEILQDQKFKIKCVGGKKDVLAYARKIQTDNISGSITLVDKDYDGIFFSIVHNPYILYTYKYSWENDLFNLKLASDVLSDLTPLDSQKARTILEKRYSHAKRRVGIISSIDAVFQNVEQTIIPKNNKSCGINIDASNDYVISSTEFKRLIGKFKSNPISSTPYVKSLLLYISNIQKDFLIQGHLWSHLVIRLIAEIYKNVTKEKSMSNQTVFNLVLSKFSKNVREYIEADNFNYYEQALRPFKI